MSDWKYRNSSSKALKMIYQQMKLPFDDGKHVFFILFSLIIIHFANFQQFILSSSFLINALYFNQKQNFSKILKVYQVLSIHVYLYLLMIQPYFISPLTPDYFTKFKFKLLVNLKTSDYF